MGWDDDDDDELPAMTGNSYDHGQGASWLPLASCMNTAEPVGKTARRGPADCSFGGRNPWQPTERVNNRKNEKLPNSNRRGRGGAVTLTLAQTQTQTLAQTRTQTLTQTRTLTQTQTPNP